MKDQLPQKRIIKVKRKKKRVVVKNSSPLRDSTTDEKLQFIPQPAGISVAPISNAVSDDIKES